MLSRSVRMQCTNLLFNALQVAMKEFNDYHLLRLLKKGLFVMINVIIFFKSDVTIILVFLL